MLICNSQKFPPKSEDFCHITYEISYYFFLQQKWPEKGLLRIKPLKTSKKEFKKEFWNISQSSQKIQDRVALSNTTIYSTWFMTKTEKACQIFIFARSAEFYSTSICTLARTKCDVTLVSKWWWPEMKQGQPMTAKCSVSLSKEERRKLGSW